MKKILLVVFLAAILLAAFFINPFAAPSGSKKEQVFSIEDGGTDDDVVTLRLRDQGFIKSSLFFNLVLSIEGKHNKFKAGGFYISKNMDAFKIADKLTNSPDLKWVSFPEGVRKEQIGEKIKDSLGWSDKQVEDWDNIYTAMKYDYFEGVYFPDTYLIPSNASGLEVAQIMINNFNEKFAKYQDGFAKKDILWTTGLKIASLIQREAAGPQDMKLISGIIWNRLLAKQKLEIDATIQYAKGKTNGKWWSVVSGEDIANINSSYNTYKIVGLPPHPIANPGLWAIDAALNPTKTDCIYYLHDRNRQIHCAKTYKEHQENIEKYLNQ